MFFTQIHRTINRRAGRVSSTLFAVLFCLASARSTPAQSTDPLQTVIPVRLNATTGDITVGTTVYKGSNPGFHLLVLSRQPTSQRDTVAVRLDQTFNDYTSAATALSSTLTTFPDALVMVNAVGNYGFPVYTSAASPAWGSLGASLIAAGGEGAATNSVIVPFTFVGNGGRQQGTALQRGYSAQDVTGYLALDSNSNYTFLQTDYVRYDIRLNGDITVGPNTYTYAQSFKNAGCDGQNAFRLVIVDRENPSRLLVNNSYCTRSDAHLGWFAQDISGINGENALVFIGSMGKPIPANWDFGAIGDPRLIPVARQMARFGGLYETVIYLSPSDTYSLVGAPPPPAGTKKAGNRARESSSVYPNKPTGELHGVLARSGRGNWYSPLNADPSGYANLGLYEILGQRPVAFPHPVGDAEVDAFRYINSQLCTGQNCNVRNQYDDLNVSISNYQSTLQNLRDTRNGRNTDCTQPQNTTLPFCVVRQQLLTEFAHVNNIRAFYNNVQSLWLGSGTVNILELLSAVNTIKATIPAPSTAPVPNIGEKIVNFILTAGSYLPEVGPVFGIADTAFNFGMDLARDKQGNKTIDLTTTVGQLEQQASDQFTAQGTTTGTLFDLIYQDWGKINALGTALAGAQSPSSPWYWSSTATARMLQGMKPAIEQAAYQSLMPAAYAIGSYLPDGNYTNNTWGNKPVFAQPQGYGVEQDRYPWHNTYPFMTPANSPYKPYTFPTDAVNPWRNDFGTATILSDNGWLGISARNAAKHPAPGGTYLPPDDTLLSKLFKPVAEGGLGVYRPAFFNSWPFPHVQCDYPEGGRRINGEYYEFAGGCDWSAAAVKPELVAGGRRITSVTIRTTQIAKTSPRQPEVNILLTVHNNGTMLARSVTITAMTLRTLAGAGQATLLSPAGPIQISNLAPGKSSSVVVRLNVPLGVTRLSLTQQGTVDSGHPQVTRFSEAQALLLP